MARAAPTTEATILAMKVPIGNEGLPQLPLSDDRRYRNTAPSGASATASAEAGEIPSQYACGGNCTASQERQAGETGLW